MSLPVPSHGSHRRVRRPRQDSGGSGVVFAASDRGRRRVFYDLVYSKAQLAKTYYADLITELSGKRGESARFSWTPPDTGVAVTVKIVRDRDLQARSTGLYAADTVLTLEVVG